MFQRTTCKEVEVTLSEGLPTTVNDHKIVDALFCDRVFAPESFQKSVDEPLMGYRYKVRVEASQGVVRTQNLLSIEGRWYIAV